MIWLPWVTREHTAPLRLATNQVLTLVRHSFCDMFATPAHRTRGSTAVRAESQPGTTREARIVLPEAFVATDGQASPEPHPAPAEHNEASQPACRTDPEPLPPAPAAKVSVWRKPFGVLGRTAADLRAYFEYHDPTLRHALAPAIVVCAVLYLRNPLSNYIFDEQEALLANPYVNGEGLGFWDAFRRDFWGLPPDRSIGSYRPLPNLIWRLLWNVSEASFLHHAVNVLIHALNGALVAAFVFALVGRREQGWLAGASFVCFAVLTEAVSGVVGIADVLGGLGVLAALHALRTGAFAPLGVFVALFLGLLSKESVIVAVPLLAWAALVLAPGFNPRKPWRFTRALTVGLAAVAAHNTWYTGMLSYYAEMAAAEGLVSMIASNVPSGVNVPT